MTTEKHLTAAQKLKRAILLKAKAWGSVDFDEAAMSDVDALFERLDADGNLQDAQNEIRCSGQASGIEVPFPGRIAMHYDYQAVAAQMSDGSWVGWTYWHGGGKHGNPEEIDWIEDAYDLMCTEREVTVIERKFNVA